MTLRQKLLVLGGAGIIPAIVVGLAGYRAILGLESNTQSMLVSSVSLRNLWEGDMMHEGLRADVYAALVSNTEEEKKKARQAAKGGDPERTRQLESCRLARTEMQRQLELTTHAARKQQITNAIAELDKRITQLSK